MVWQEDDCRNYWSSTRKLGGLVTDTVIGSFDPSLPGSDEYLVKSYHLYMASPLVIIADPRRILIHGIHSANTITSVYSDSIRPTGDPEAVEAQIGMGLHTMESDDFEAMRDLLRQAVANVIQE